ncbi:hypothetical protein [Desulfofundulus sp.]|uniref:hypothetical protein n=1 Tax=Desulfofundulus sp. TaxID=2282750 RepID=UPI003C78D891
MRKILSLVLALLLLLPALPARADSAGSQEPRTVYKGFVKPLRVALGDDGAIYVLDGMVLKKCKAGQVTVVADMLASREYFAKYGLGEIEDLYTFRPGTMVYAGGALFITGLMVDRYLPPRPYFQSQYELGEPYTVTVKITDHFEPVLVEKSYVTLNIDSDELRGLMLNDPSYTDHWMYQDYTARFRNLYIPNLVPAPDGNMYVLKPTARESVPTISLVPGDDGNLHTGFRVRMTHGGGCWGLYKLYPDGHQEFLEEAEYSYPVDTRPEKHFINDFIDTSNKYLREMNDPDPDNDTIYALPSHEDPETSVIACNESYLWKYNFKEHTYQQVEFIPGNEMPSGNGMSLMPDHVYSPTMPRATKTLGVFFLSGGEYGNAWRLYADRYYQDLGNLTLFGPAKVTDWTINEDTRTIYQLLDDGRLVAADFSKYVQYAPGQKPGQQGSGVEFEMPGDTFKVMSDQNRQTIYGVKGPRGPYKKDGVLYVPIDPVAYILNISVHEDSMVQAAGNIYAIRLSNPRFGSSRYIKVYVDKKGDVIQKHASLDELMNAIYELTGMRYKVRYDVTTNTLYIQPEVGSMQLFEGWWR